MKELIQSTFHGKNIRHEIDENGKVWFVSADVMGVLGIKSQAHALRKLKNEQRGFTILHSLGGDQEFATVNESGLYALVFQSRSKEALVFQSWVTEEVLPKIRENGFYKAPQAMVVHDRSRGSDNLMMLKSTIDELIAQREQAERIVNQVDHISTELKTVAAEAKQATDTLTSEQIGLLTAEISKKAKDYGVYKITGILMGKIKKEFIRENLSRRTYKEIKRDQFDAAMDLVRAYIPDQRILDEGNVPYVPKSMRN